MKKAEKRKVVFIGTGLVGMSYAYAILNLNLCDELVLIDINKKKAEGEAMDLNHGVAFSGGNMEIYAGEFSDCRDADLLVLTAGLPQKERQSRLDLLKENRKIFFGKQFGSENRIHSGRSYRDWCRSVFRMSET